jgi:3D (Asp-Asp-Asp) domain-containing protein
VLKQSTGFIMASILFLTMAGYATLRDISGNSKVVSAEESNQTFITIPVNVPTNNDTVTAPVFTREDSKVLVSSLKMPKNLGKFKVTAYDLSESCCDKGRDHPAFGITKSGKNLKGLSRRSAMSVAVDPKLIKLGTQLYIQFEGEYSNFSGMYTAVDTGGKIGGKVLDLFMGDFGKTEADQSVWDFGVRSAEVTVVEEVSELDRTEIMRHVVSFSVDNLASTLTEEEIDRLEEIILGQISEPKYTAKSRLSFLQSSSRFNLAMDSGDANWVNLILSSPLQQQYAMLMLVGPDRLGHIGINSVSARLFGTSPPRNTVGKRLTDLANLIYQREYVSTMGARYPGDVGF